MLSPEHHFFCPDCAGNFFLFGCDSVRQLGVRAYESFLVDQHPLSCESPTISTKLSAAADYAVTRNHKRDSISGACACDGSNCARLPDPSGDLLIRLNFSIRYRLQIVPDADLKCCRPNIHGQVQMGCRPCEVCVQRVYPFLKIRMIWFWHG